MDLLLGRQDFKLIHSLHSDISLTNLDINRTIIQKIEKKYQLAMERKTLIIKFSDRLPCKVRRKRAGVCDAMKMGGAHCNIGKTITE